MTMTTRAKKWIFRFLLVVFILLVFLAVLVVRSCIVVMTAEDDHKVWPRSQSSKTTKESAK